MTKYIIEGGKPLSGSVRPSGNKNEALPALMACLITDEPITFKRVPRIKDVETVCEILADLGVEVSWNGDDCLGNGFSQVGFGIGFQFLKHEG